MGQILAAPQCCVGGFIGREGGEEFPISTEQRDGDGLIPAPFGSGKGEAALRVQADDTLHMMQTPVEPMG
jgi:hypothetical protein